jgi:hypothetical protein
MRALLILLILAADTASAQKGVPVTVEGTHVRMVPPENFSPSRNFFGFQDEDTGSSIMVSELPTPWSQISGAFEEDLLEKKMEVASIHAINFQGYPGKWVIATQRIEELSFLKYILVFGDEQRTIMVVSNSPEHMNKLGLSMKASLMTTRYDPKMKVDPLAALPFTIDTRKSLFKKVEVLSGSATFSTDKGSYLLAGPSIAPVVTTDLKQFAIDRFRLLPGGDEHTIEQVEQVSIDGMDGYEIIGSGTDASLTQALIYFTILYTEERDYFLLTGKSKEKEVDVTTYRKIAQTFSQK